MDDDICVSGVDPGSKGAVTFLYPAGGIMAVYDLPVYKVDGTSRTHTYADGAALTDLLDRHAPASSFLEKVHFIKGDGGMGSFTFGDNFGTIKGVHAGMRIPLTQVPPQVWKKSLRVPADKAQAVARARELFPACSALFTRPDKAESAMIALYGLLSMGHAMTKRFTPA